ncbi:adenylate/guanylate cyclase domain-containing protein [Chitinilyticum piscinae]|uniref:Adenylate/guanylate cyclase domain-containing protein n=1 Tax=Chitinilyticum piscinae TaxID=2866724 RepID=A0A8J7FMQ5_9NEIS|nr:adenylate/guanylate cyclase domain-containing protein [Chitinilyticum piscinae]MBE9611012.1 adenylate/guanylate cyclase domain-containing protein [Chitinilyticum piscinae]
MLRRFSYLTLLLVLLALLAADYGHFNFTRIVDERAGDALLRGHAPRHPAASDIVVIDIDQKSLEQMNAEAGKWPWPRSTHAELIAGIAAQQPRAIVFDILFNELDVDRPDADQLFRETVAQIPVVRFPTMLLNDGSSSLTAGEMPKTLNIRQLPAANPQARPPLLLPNIVAPQFQRGGLINFAADADGIGRHYFLYRDFEGWRIPSLPAALASEFGWKLPEDTDRIRLNWHSGREHISYADVYLDAQREKKQRPADEFRNKIVIIGTAAPGLWDLRATSLDSSYPGVDILASAIDNLQQQDWLRSPPRAGFALLAALLMGLLAIGFQCKVNTLKLGTGLLGISALLGAAAWQSLRSKGLFLPLAAPVAWAWGYFWSAALLAYLAEKAQREQAIAMFGRVIDKRVVAELMNAGDIHKLKEAGSREITVLFSDIRGFTTLSETRSPEYIVNLLNRYFSKQVEIIFKHGGTLDKFIGDAIMAFWGAPVDDPRHARNAVAAAIEMSAELERFKSELTDLGADFDIGIGLHTGRAVVGFIGAEAQTNYTTIGDTVNLASRIEGLTKGVSRVLVSDATRAACADEFEFIPHGSHHVKGREQPVELFEPREKH